MKLLTIKDYILLIDKKAKISEENYVYSVLYGIGKIIRDIGGESTKKYRPLIAKFQESEVQQEYGRDGIWQMGVMGEKVAKNNCKKVIAYYPLTKEAKELEGLPLLPPFEDSFNITKWAKEEHKYNHKSIHELSFVLGCEIGYQKSQSKQFSLEDMVSFSEYVGNYYADIHKPVIQTEELLNNFIQSLSTGQQLPKEFIPNIFYRTSGTGRIIGQKEYNGFSEQMKLQCKLYFESNNNSEGKEEIQGTYKY